MSGTPAEPSPQSPLSQLIELYGWLNELAENEYEYNLMHRLHTYRMKLKDSATFYESSRDIIYKKHTETNVREDKLRELLDTQIDAPSLQLTDSEVEKLFINIKAAHCMSKINGKYVLARDKSQVDKSSIDKSISDPSPSTKTISLKDARDVRMWMANNSQVEYPAALLKQLFNVYAYVHRHTTDFDVYLQESMKKYKLTTSQNGKHTNYTGLPENVLAFTDDLNEKLNSMVEIPVIKLTEDDRKKLIKKLDDLRVVEVFAGLE